MAQTGYEEVVKSWETFLKANPSRFIRVRNTDRLVDIDGGRSGARKTYFYWKDIAKEHKSVADWMDTMILKYNLENIEVYFRKNYGGSGSKDDPAMKNSPYKLTNRLKQLKERTTLNSMENTATEASTNTQMQDSGNGGYSMPQQSAPGQHYVQPPQYQPNPSQSGLGYATMQGMGGLGQAAMAAGMSMPEFVQVLKKADKVDEMKDELNRIKDETKTDIIKLKEENSSLRTKLNEAESKVSIAEQSKDMAVLAEKLNKKSWADNEAFQELLRTAPQVLSAVLSKGQGQAPGLAGGMNLSPAKQDLIGYIQDEDVKDNMALILQNSLMAMIGRPGFDAQLMQLNAQANAGQ